MNLSSSLEDYLEAIYNIKNKEGYVRVTDISRELNVEKPSVFMAIKKLKNLKLVIHEKYGDIILTKRGEEEALRVKKKHDVLLMFLTDLLGLSRKEAEKDACRIEHVICDNTFERLSKFINFLYDYDLINKKNWLETFEEYINTNNTESKNRIN